MQLSSIRPGDLVKCDVRGQAFFAEVSDRERGALLIQPVSRVVTYRRVKAREVIAHYRKSKASVR